MMNHSQNPSWWTAAALLGAAALLAGCPKHGQKATVEDVPPAIQRELAELRAANERAGATFSIGFNPAMLKPIEDLAGTVAPKDLADRITRQHPIGQEMFRLDIEARDQFASQVRLSALDKLRVLPELVIQCAANRASWDWRLAGAVSPVKDQQCGNCWAYASAAALESSNLIRNISLIDVSEQYIVNCAVDNGGEDAGTCGGGWHEGVFEYMIAHGVAGEASLPDSGADAPCDPNISAPYRAVAWDYVATPAPATGFGDSIPTVDSLKQALCEHGPLAVGVLATDNFQAYTGHPNEVFNEPLPDSTLIYTWEGNNLKYHSINHDVLLIGWSDSKHAWLIKNSWSTGWGTNAGVGSASDKGYMWIDYGSNNIGLGAAWVQAKHRAYRLPPIYLERFRPLVPFPDPGPLRFEDLNQRLMQGQRQ
jgi:Papain family cysteine protease